MLRLHPGFRVRLTSAVAMIRDYGERWRRAARDLAAHRSIWEHTNAATTLGVSCPAQAALDMRHPDPHPPQTQVSSALMCHLLSMILCHPESAVEGSRPSLFPAKALPPSQSPRHRHPWRVVLRT